VDKAMEQLESFRYKQGDDFIKWLREQVNHMDFEKISELDISDIPELQKKPAKKKIRILVINDSGIILRNAIGWLGDRYDVIPANSETMAMKYLSRNSADLILMNDIKTKEGEKQAYHTLFEELKSKGIPFAFVEGKWDKMKVTEAVVVLLKNM
jgi:hypothetical protein